MTINKATVLGAGNMGSQIAALLVNAGIQVTLLDIVIDKNEPNKLSKASYDRITHPKKGQLFSPDFASRLSYGNFNDDLTKTSDSDLFIEAVSEDLTIKHDLWGKIAKIAKPTAILTTNTSGIPIKDIADVFDEETKKRFLGLHFFNPPRHMKLVEVIPHETTASTIIDKIDTFVIRELGKGVVRANDVGSFVANRIGVYTMFDIMRRAEQQGLTVNQTDALTGQVIGRPKTATYRLTDLVGVDIAYHVGKGMAESEADAERWEQPTAITQLVEKGYLGNKTKQGFYKRTPDKQFLVYDYKSQDYVKPEKVEFEILSQLGKNLKHNLDVLFDTTDEFGKFIWDTLANVMYYAAINVPRATNDYKNVDRSMVWGFNWKLGPFQLWDMIGFEKVKERLTKDIGPLPEWVMNRTEPFYGENDNLDQVPSLKDFVRKEIWNHKGISQLYETDNSILIYSIGTPNNTITGELSDDLVKAVDYLENSDYRAMVIDSPGVNFSLGANLVQVSDIIKDGKASTEVPGLVDSLHTAVKAIKYTSKPIVTAASGMALGGGTELLLHSPFVVASQETYMGLVEMGVGVIPSGGGLAELAERIYKKDMKRAQEIAELDDLFNNIITAKVSSNAYEARRMGYLKETDLIINNSELILEAAIQKADLEATYNYIPNTPIQYKVQGTNWLAVSLAKINSLVDGNFATEYDGVIATEVAKVLAGGEVPLYTHANGDWLRSLEKQGFTKLSQNKKTLERIDHMLKTKKPLRN